MHIPVEHLQRPNSLFNSIGTPDLYVLKLPEPVAYEPKQPKGKFSSEIEFSIKKYPWHSSRFKFKQLISWQVPLRTIFNFQSKQHTCWDRIGENDG